MNIDKLDKIILSEEDKDLLFQWKDNHKDYVRNFKPVLQEGVIKIGNYHTQVFKGDNDSYQYTVLHNNKKVHEVIWSKTTQIGKTVFTLLEGIDVYAYNNSIITLHTSVMAYMEYYSDKKEYVEVAEVSSLKNRKTKKKSSTAKTKKSPVRIRKKIYSINVTNEAIKRDKVRYQRKAEKWTVRGHWRTYKSGKRIWIKPQVRGEGKEIEPKSYKL